MAKATRIRKIVRPLRGGQITIPAEFREQLGINEDTLLEVTLRDGELLVRPVKVAAGAGSSIWAKKLYELFEPVREEVAKRGGKRTVAEIERALAEVRGRRSRP